MFFVILIKIYLFMAESNLKCQYFFITILLFCGHSTLKRFSVITKIRILYASVTYKSQIHHTIVINIASTEIIDQCCF